ncbi:unnamed protein product [Urochloa humidicola]
MGYSKMFYFPWLADDGPGDTCLADLDNKNQQQQQPAANLTQEQELFSNAYPSAPKIILNGKDGGVDGDAWEALLLTAAQMESLTSLLANATTPEQQRLILGERLYPVVQQLEPYQAPKVTGMLLEMDQTEILHLLVSPEALKSMVAEAMDVLHKAYSSALATQIAILTSALANTTPEEQRLILGERLYPLVQQLEPYQAPKVTGMLLELDQTEILHLLVSPEALKSRVAEAMTVLWKAYFSAPKIIHNTEKQGGERGSREVVKPRERMRSPR